MLPYLVTFSFSLMLLQMSRSVKISGVQVIIILIALSLPSVLAGLRDFEIGTDTRNYISYWHVACRDWEWVDYWRSSANSALEELYLVFSFLVSKVTYNDQLFLFFTQFLILIPIAYAAHRLRVNIVWVVFIYLAILFNTSLNTTRQVIAISFCLLSLSFLIQNKYRNSILWVIVAYGFHHSAILFIAFIALDYWLKDHVLGKKKSVVFLISICIVLFFTVFSFIGIHILEKFFGEYSVAYGSDNKFGTKFPIALFGLSLFNTLIYGIIVKGKKQGRKLYLFNYIVYLCPAICFSGLASRYAVRVVYYPLFMAILIFPYLIKTNNVSPRVKCMMIIGYSAYFFLTAVPYETAL